MKTKMNPIRKRKGFVYIALLAAIGAVVVVWGYIAGPHAPTISPQGQNMQAWGDAIKDAQK